MENITTGHWIFAGIFMIIFVGYLIWSYRKDLNLHKVQYGGSGYFLGGLLLILFLLYVVKQFVLR